MAKVVLLTAKWCGFCPSAKAALKAAGIPFSTIDADTPKGRALAQKHAVTGVPTPFVDGVPYPGGIEALVKASKK